MNTNLFEELLNEEEGATLDFKRQQYKFVGATDDEKSEIIKDILAFANAWRRTDAYILIGVEEVKGGRSKVVGITDHIDDASLQQLVNSKTQRPVMFSYEAFSFEGKQIGVITVPLQERPFYLIKNYGRLNKEVVYIRRGSSTSEAKLDEIAKMGVSVTPIGESPKLKLEFVDREEGKGLGDSITISSEVVRYDASQIPDYRGTAFASFFDNPRYKKEMAAYIKAVALLRRINFKITNTSNVLATNVRLVIPVKKESHLLVIDSGDYPEKPSKADNLRAHIPNMSHLNNPYTVSQDKYEWTVNVALGSLQPKAVYTPRGSFYVGSTSSYELQLDGTLFGDNIPEPIKVPLNIKFDVTERDLDMKELA